jgi:Na+/H+ antiporter NhaD/arsenite permease-like protein
MGVAMALTGFNDNAAISYLVTLIPNWGEVFKYAIFTGVIAGGGLTVIANAPNPAGYAILKKHFHEGIKPLPLLLGALIPTFLLYLIFYFFGPLF